MIHITKKELEKYPFIGGGAFGYVYQVDDHTAYKIYRLDFYDAFGTVIKNPCLHYPNIRLQRLKNRGPYLQYSEVFSDYIFMDGEFAGIEIPFYDGRRLYHYHKFTFPEKIDASKQMIRNSKELKHHLIYPKDYRLSNMIYLEDGTLRFIDLDDILTKVCLLPNLYYSRESTIGMGETIYSFFHSCHTLPYSSQVAEKLGKGKEISPTSYKQMREYILQKEKEYSFISVDENSDLSKLREFLNSHPYSVLYQVKDQCVYEDDFYFSLLQEFQEYGISIFDCIAPSENIESYSRDYNTVDAVKLKNDQFVKVKK